MKRAIALLSFLLFAATAAISQTAASGGCSPDLSAWAAGTTVDSQWVERVGLDNCFTAIPIPDGVWQRMQGRSYRQNPHIGRSDLRYLRVLHSDYDGLTHLGEMVCHQLIAGRLLAIFRELYQASYPIERMVLPDVYDADDERQMRANNSSCFCYRTVSHSSKLSKHSLGLAVDLNTRYNPYYKRRADGTLFVQPSTSREYCDRSRTFPYKIAQDDLALRLFRQQGFEWGGDWKSCKDFQHFEFAGQ